MEKWSEIGRKLLVLFVITVVFTAGSYVVLRYCVPTTGRNDMWANAGKQICAGMAPFVAAGFFVTGIMGMVQVLIKGIMK